MRVAYRSHPLVRSIKRHFWERYYNKLIKKNRNIRILVLLHLYYDESWIEIREYLQNLRLYTTQLIVTCTKGRIQQSTIDSICTLYRNSRVIYCENKGYDLGPFFEACRVVNACQFDVIIKLHSKGTKRPIQFNYNQLFFRRSWFSNLFEGVVSAKNIHRIVDELANSPDIDIAAAHNLIVHDPKYKAKHHSRIAASQGLVLPRNYRYVAGTCFAMSTRHFTRLQQLNYSLDDFEDTSESEIWDLAHFLERYICTVDTNRQFYVTHCCTVRRMLTTPLTPLLKHVFPRLKKLRDKRLNRDSYGPL